jgi:Rrf2 family iron-sulfur cluster assembly transcriptional regulator
MSTLFSRQCEYALQAVLYLALQENNGMIPIRALARTLGAPQHFLAKILQRLVHQGVLQSSKGPNGGFALAIPAEDISLYKIVETIDGKDLSASCVLGFPDCTSESPCALHEQWARSRDNMIRHLKDKSIGQMAKSMKKDHYLLQSVLPHQEGTAA